MKVLLTYWHFENGLIDLHTTLQSVEIFFSIICYSAHNAGKMSKTSLSTKHSCSSEMVVYVLRLPVLSETVMPNLFHLLPSVLTETPK